MNVIPLESKQISHLLYNDTTHELLAHYCTGEIKSYSSVPVDAFETLLRSDNKYDCFVKLTSGR